MPIYIGTDVLHEGTIKHVQDTDMLNGLALIGLEDTNGLVPETKWVNWDELQVTKRNLK